MPDWNQAQYQGINPGLLQQLVNMPSKNAAGINALSQGVFGDSNQHGAMGSLQNMIQKQQQQKSLQQLMQSLQGGGGQGQQSMMQQPGGGMPNPMAQSMGQNTTMMNDPLGIFGNLNG